jgi:hypothetical protein
VDVIDTSESETGERKKWRKPRTVKILKDNPVDDPDWKDEEADDESPTSHDPQAKGSAPKASGSRPARRRRSSVRHYIFSKGSRGLKGSSAPSTSVEEDRGRPEHPTPLSPRNRVDKLKEQSRQGSRAASPSRSIRWEDQQLSRPASRHNDRSA